MGWAILPAAGSPGVSRGDGDRQARTPAGSPACSQDWPPYKIAGGLFPVFHFHQGSFSLFGFDSGFLEIDVVPGRMVVNVAEVSGNIWGLTQQR